MVSGGILAWRYFKAFEYGLLATDLEPNNPEIWFRRGNLYWEVRDMIVACLKQATLKTGCAGSDPAHSLIYAFEF